MCQQAFNRSVDLLKGTSTIHKGTLSIMIAPDPIQRDHNPDASLFKLLDHVISKKDPVAEQETFELHTMIVSKHPCIIMHSQDIVESQTGLAARIAQDHALKVVLARGTKNSINGLLRGLLRHMFGRLRQITIITTKIAAIGNMKPRLQGLFWLQHIVLPTNWSILHHHDSRLQKKLKDFLHTLNSHMLIDSAEIRKRLWSGKEIKQSFAFFINNDEMTSLQGPTNQPFILAYTDLIDVFRPLHYSLRDERWKVAFPEHRGSFP
jgi:hypothetical protein